MWREEKAPAFMQHSSASKAKMSVTLLVDSHCSNAFTVTQMSTRWHHCSNFTCGSCLNLWCPGLSTKTSWTAQTCWTPAAQRSVWESESTQALTILFVCIPSEVCRCFKYVCPFISYSYVLTGLGKAGEANSSSPQNQLQSPQLCLPVSGHWETNHYRNSTEPRRQL